MKTRAEFDVGLERAIEMSRELKREQWLEASGHYLPRIDVQLYAIKHWMRDGRAPSIEQRSYIDLIDLVHLATHYDTNPKLERFTNLIIEVANYFQFQPREGCAVTDLRADETATISTTLQKERTRLAAMQWRESTKVLEYDDVPLGGVGFPASSLHPSLAHHHSEQCGCPAWLTAQVGLGPHGRDVTVVTCLRCLQTAMYRTQSTEVRRDTYEHRIELCAPAPATLRWLDSFPRKISGGGFVPASTQIHSKDELSNHLVGDSTMRLVDRFCEAGIPESPPPSGAGAFKEVLRACQAKDTATFRQWVEWSSARHPMSTHPWLAAPFARDVVYRLPDPVPDLVSLLRAEGHLEQTPIVESAGAFLRGLGKGHPDAIAWVHEEAKRLKRVPADKLRHPLYRLLHFVECIRVPELVPQLTALEMRLAAPWRFTRRIDSIVNGDYPSSNGGPRLWRLLEETNVFEEMKLLTNKPR